MIALMVGGGVVSELTGLEPSRSVSEYKYDEWLSPPGLPYPSVRALGQDPDGYLWMGTRMGMARFDGINLTPFTQKNLPILPHNGILAFASDNSGGFWVGTEKGLLRRQAGVWTRFAPEITEPVTALMCDPDGVVWVATNTRLFQIKSDKLELYPTPGVTFRSIRSIIRCTNGNIITMGTPTVLISDGQAKMLGVAAGLAHDNSTAAAADGTGGVWIGTTRGLHYYKNGAVSSYSTKDGLPVNAVRSLLVDDDGNVLIGSSAGLTRLTGGKFDNLMVRGDEHLSHLLCILEDREKNIWLGIDAGFARLTDAAFSHLTRRHGLLSESATSILHSRDGSAWVSTLGGGLTHFMPEATKSLGPSDGLPADSIVSMQEDAEGGLWLGYFSLGVVHLRDGKITRYLRQQRTEINYSVVAIDSSQQVWVANELEGLLRFNGTDFEKVACPGLVMPRNVVIDRQGIVWVAGSNGAGCFRDGEWKLFPKPPAARMERPISMIVDPAGGVWVLQEGAELHRYDGQNVAMIAFNPEEIGPLSYGGVIHNGEMWLNVRFGLLRVTLAELSGVLAGKKKSPAFVLYNESTGMKSRAPNISGIPSVSVDAQGRIWSTTSRGVAIIDPGKIPFNALPPGVVIERVEADKIERPLDALQTIPPGRGELAFKFTALSLTESQRVQFKYRLAGFEEDWSAATTSREAYYGGLSPGNYRFEVMGSNNDGIWNTQPAKLELRILPFFYQRTDFQILGAVLFLGIVGGVVQWRVRNVQARARALHAQNALLEQRIAERTGELANSYRVLQESQRQLMDASRMAGIAEMAISVLHNIGNALNSVKTSASVVIDIVQRINPAGITKATQLMRQQGEGVGEFLLRDPRGLLLPEYLEKAAGQIDDQKVRALTELQGLQAGAENIAQIVAAQSSLAKSEEVVELVQPSDLVGTALRLTEGAALRAGVKVITDLTAVAAVKVDRHKAVQVIGCLLQNAIIALERVEPSLREIRLGLHNGPADCVRIEVAAAGRGLSAEDLIRIFAMGYAERPGEYGFGVHASAIAAKELGGELTVESAGETAGAVFALVLPALKQEGQ